LKISDDALKVLIVDDEVSQRTGLAAMVTAWGMTAETAAEGNEALEKLARYQADVILTDLSMPGLDGFGFLQRLREMGDMPPTIVLTAFGNIETAVRTVHELGAYWFLEKPIQPKTLEVLVRRAGSHAELRAQKRTLERQLGYKGALGQLVGRSARMQEIFALLQQAGPSKAGVLITGESGTGKELVARTIHDLSPRRQGPFIAINCAALPETLIESELFGHEKGSFTGADAQKKGKIEYADGGTLFLDEVGELPLLLQVKLLRFLQERQVERVGGRAPIEVKARLIAATNRELKKEIAEGRFREDLYYRLGVVMLTAPPLRERGEDIVKLANHFLAGYAAQYKKPIRAFRPDAVAALKSYAWPGNVRELENKVKRAVILSEKKAIASDDLDIEPPAGNGAAESLREVREAAEKEHVLKVLGKCKWNISKAAQELGISRPTLHDFLKKHQLSKGSG